MNIKQHFGLGILGNEVVTLSNNKGRLPVKKDPN